MKLPSHQALVSRSELIRAQIAAFAAEHSDDPLVWCDAPRLGSMVYARMAQPHRVPSELARTEVKRMRDNQTARRQRLAPGVTGGLVGDGCVFMASNTNMRRAQAPLYERFGPVRRVSRQTGASYWHARRLLRRAVAGARELIDHLRRGEVEFPIDSAAICLRFMRTARLIGYWEDLLASESPKVAVVGSVTAPRGRALVHAAERAAVPTVYIPHSPQSTVNVELAAMPMDYAGLRGTEETAYLADQGVDRDRLDVVGDPTISPQAPPEIDAGLGPAFAAGLEDMARLSPLVGTIHEALGHRVTVGRHPATDPAVARDSFPAEWRIFDGRTYDLLTSGPPMVVQHSSGVALEALHLGIPVIELQYPGRPALYPFTREPYVRFASTSEELSAAAAAASADAVDADRRAALVGWARSWSSPTGAEAGERAVAVVERAAAQGPRGRIWDPW